MSATTIQTRIEELLATGLTFTQIKKIIETKANRLPEGPAKLELRRAWKQVDRMANPQSSAAETATALITNRQPISDERAMQAAEAAADRAGTIRDETAKHAARVAMEKSPIREGIFTVVCADNTHRTFRIKKHWDAAEEAKGTLVAQYLSGPDNESSYTGMAFISAAGKVILWKRFRSGFNTLTTALHFLVQSGDYEEAGMLYAKETGHCCKCGRRISRPDSMIRGMGPVCAAGGRD